MMLGTPARLAMLRRTVMRIAFWGANSSIQTAAPTATGMAKTTVNTSTQTEPRMLERMPARSAKREG